MGWFVYCNFDLRVVCGCCFLVLCKLSLVTGVADMFVACIRVLMICFFYL